MIQEVVTLQMMNEDGPVGNCIGFEKLEDAVQTIYEHVRDRIMPGQCMRIEIGKRLADPEVLKAAGISTEEDEDATTETQEG